MKPVKDKRSNLNKKDASVINSKKHESQSLNKNTSDSNTAKQDLRQSHNYTTHTCWYVYALSLLLCICLFGTLIYPTNSTSENTPMTPAPRLIQNDTINMNFLSDAGAWFNNHFFLREYLVTLYDQISLNVFRHSPQDSVVLGKDNWLYYYETMPDYTGESLLSQKELNAIIHNLQLMKFSANAQGADFLVTLAPNKASIYPEHVPDGYLKGEKSNLNLFKEACAAAGIQYIDLYEALESKKSETPEQLYYQRDSHWNSTGALCAYNILMNSLGLMPKNYEQTDLTYTTHQGDLDLMLLPKGAENEPELDYSPYLHYTSSSDDPMAEFIETQNDQGAGSMLVYRDSFGSNLIPFLSDTFSQVWYDRLVPYNFYEISSLKPEHVLLERAERNIREFASKAVYMSMPAVNMDQWQFSDAFEYSDQIEFTSKSVSDFWYLEFQVPEDLIQENSEIYLRVNDQSFATPVFYLIEDGTIHYGVYLEKQHVQDNSTVQVLLKNQNNVLILTEREIK